MSSGTAVLVTNQSRIFQSSSTTPILPKKKPSLSVLGKAGDDLSPAKVCELNDDWESTKALAIPTSNLPSSRVTSPPSYEATLLCPAVPHNNISYAISCNGANNHVTTTSTSLNNSSNELRHGDAKKVQNVKRLQVGESSAIGQEIVPVIKIESKRFDEDSDKFPISSIDDSESWSWWGGNCVVAPADPASDHAHCNDSASSSAPRSGCKPSRTTFDSKISTNLLLPAEESESVLRSGAIVSDAASNPSTFFGGGGNEVVRRQGATGIFIKYEIESVNSPQHNSSIHCSPTGASLGTPENQQAHSGLCADTAFCSDGIFHSTSEMTTEISYFHDVNKPLYFISCVIILTYH